MKILAVNSSARTGRGSKTELLLDHLVEGMREAGAEVEVVNLRHKKVKNCLGCFTCWTKTPGVCVHKDDMTEELFPKFIASDLMVLATPLYHYTVNAAMKTFIERTLPILEPYLRAGDGGRTRHPLRARHPAVAFLSVAGFPENKVFRQLSSYVNFLYRDTLAAEIYRSASEVLTQPLFREKTQSILAAVKEAGRQLAASLKVSEEVMAWITQPLFDNFNFMREMANLFWDTCINEGLSPKEFDEKGLTPRPDSIETFMIIMSMGFNPEAASGTEATLQFVFSGAVGEH
ncbi:MAG: flavodoxin family protein, partial [Pseudomonadota bacterium]